MKKYLKYIVAIAIFLVILIFIGDSSLIRQIRRARAISALKEQKEEYIDLIRDAEHRIDDLRSTDSLERFARETYFMHTPGETIYVVE